MLVVQQADCEKIMHEVWVLRGQRRPPAPPPRLFTGPRTGTTTNMSHDPDQFIKYTILQNKFLEDKSNNVFGEIRKCFRKTAKFEFFAKEIIYLESPDHPLQNDV